MNYVIQAHSPPEIEDQYLVSFDFDAMRGTGYGIFTDKPEHAMRFKTLRDAMEFWRTQSTVKPFRPDGMPNRPLTASTISIFKVEEKDNGPASEDDAARRHHGSSHHQG
jgi:hypothetical protein